MATGVFSTALLRAARAGTRVLEHSILTRAAARQPRSEWRHAVDAAYGAAVPAAFVAAGISVISAVIRDCCMPTASVVSLILAMHADNDCTASTTGRKWLCSPDTLPSCCKWGRKSAQQCD